MTMPWSASCDRHRVYETDMVIPDQDGGSLTLTCRFPAEGAAKGIVVFCHGLGANSKAYAPLSHDWAQQGYLVVHPNFADSIFAIARARPDMGLDPHDPALALWARNRPELRPVMHQILHDPKYWLDRLRIVQQVMAEMGRIVAATGVPSPGPAVADATARDQRDADLPIAIAGHSFGAYTAQLLAGAEIDLPDGARNFRDPRFCAALVLSGQGRDQQGLRAGSWDAMTGPVLTVTGKKDGGAKGQDWHWKCEPFELAPAGGKYLAVLGDAGHYLGGMTPEGDSVPHLSEALSLVTTAFLDAHVMNRSSARHWLDLIEDQIGECQVVFAHK